MNTNPLARIALCAATLCAMAGCVGTADMGAPPAPSSTRKSASPRKLIKRAWLTVNVKDVAAAVVGAARIVEEAKGYVESSSATKGESASLYVRVPAPDLDACLDKLAKLGKEANRRVSARDVTDQYIDTAAKLKNYAALRDRLRALLDKATKVQDVLAIECELARVQAEADSLQGRLKALGTQVHMASIELDIERKTILGPLGYLGAGVIWVIEKLFVIR